MNYGEFLYTSNTIAYWRFEGDSLDETPNNNDGDDESTQYGLQYGRFGHGAEMGIDEFIRIGNKSPFSFEYNSTFTISAWCRLYVIPSEKDSFQLICSKQANSKYNDPGYYFGFDGKNDFSGGTLMLMMCDGTHYARIESKLVLTETDVWMSCIVTSSGNAEDGIKLYINGVDYGVDIDENAGSMGSILNSAYFKISAHESAYGGYLQGDLDELIVENVVWSPNKIKHYYTQCMGRFAPSLG